MTDLGLIVELKMPIKMNKLFILVAVMCSLFIEAAAQNFYTTTFGDNRIFLITKLNVNTK